MYRAFKIAGSVICLLLGLLVASVNATPASTLIAFAVAVAGLCALIVSTNGMYTGYWETLNTDLASARGALALLFRSAKRSIKIVSGRFNPALYLSADVFQALRDALNRGVKVEVLLAEPGADLEDVGRLASAETLELWREFKSWVLERKVSVRRVPHRARRHFMLVDDAHVRLEEAHPRGFIPADLICTKRRARIIYFDENIERHVKRFGKLSAQATLLEVEAA